MGPNICPRLCIVCPKFGLLISPLDCFYQLIIIVGRSDKISYTVNTVCTIAAISLRIVEDTDSDSDFDTVHREREQSLKLVRIQ